MKTLLAVTVLRSSLGTFTNKVSIDLGYTLKVELDNTLKYLRSLYPTIDEVLLIEHNEVFARWNGREWLTQNGPLD